jgi:hypothetical protein
MEPTIAELRKLAPELDWRVESTGFAGMSYRGGDLRVYAVGDYDPDSDTCSRRWRVDDGFQAICYSEWRARMLARQGVAR